jgi:signal transduction histidine kinase
MPAGISADQMYLFTVGTVNVGGIIGLTAILTVAVMLLIFVLFYRGTVKRKINHLLGIVSQATAETAEVKSVLGALDIGVIAYGSDGRLLTLNAMAKHFLPEIPLTMLDFLNQYGEDNGLKASFFLGATELTDIFEVGGRKLALSISERPLELKRHSGRIVTLRDISAEDREEQRRKDFVANVSHELKTPLTTIKTYSESLLDWGIEEKSKEALRKDVTRIYDDSIRMETLIEDLLLLSSLDNRGLPLKVETLDFARLVRLTTERMQIQAAGKNVTLNCVVVAQIPPVLADRAALERILVNLISNAIKYSPEKSEIFIYVGTIVDDVYVKVKDRGPGISPEHHEHIFKRFFRVDNTGSRRYGGTGLGLSIVRELADLHRGKIELKSDLGRGSEFTLLIPGKRKVLRDTRTLLLEGNRPVDAVGRAAAEEIEEREALFLPPVTGQQKVLNLTANDQE